MANSLISRVPSTRCPSRRPEATIPFLLPGGGPCSPILRARPINPRQVLWTVEAQIEKALTEPPSPEYRRLLSEARGAGSAQDESAGARAVPRQEPGA